MGDAHRSHRRSPVDPAPSATGTDKPNVPTSTSAATCRSTPGHLATDKVVQCGCVATPPTSRINISLTPSRSRRIAHSALLHTRHPFPVSRTRSAALLCPRLGFLLAGSRKEDELLSVDGVGSAGPRWWCIWCLLELLPREVRSGFAGVC
jgi:hypothetical protein